MTLNDYFFLIPLAILIGVAALGAFMWSLSNSQYEDLDGAAERILFDEDRPIPPKNGDDRLANQPEATADRCS